MQYAGHIAIPALLIAIAVAIFLGLTFEVRDRKGRNRKWRGISARRYSEGWG